jgi:hypothetical protein
VWQGPYNVITRQGPTTYLIKVGKKEQLVTTRRLKPCQENIQTEHEMVEQEESNNADEIRALEERIANLKARQQQLASATTDSLVNVMIMPQSLCSLW